MKQKKLDLHGLSPKTNGNYRRSERMVVYLHYKPPVQDGDEDYSEEFSVVKIVPPCPLEGVAWVGLDKDKLCPKCWLIEYISAVGLEEALTNDLEFEGRGSKERNLALSGEMVSELLPSTPNHPDEWDEYFEVISVDVLDK